MKIVVLDGVPLNPGDLNWDELAKLGDLTVHERTAPDEVGARIQGADLVLTNKVKVRAEHITANPQLKYIGELATGFDNVDAKAAREAGIPVSNVPSYSSGFTAQTAISLLLELAQRVGLHSDAVLAGQWASSPDFSFALSPQIELAGKTLVIIGMGTIGKQTAQIAEAFGMKVIAAQLPGRPASSDRVPLDEALAQADAISLHCPLRDETRGLVNANFISKLKPTALLVNTARGAIVDEAALATALAEGKLAGFAGDVLSTEPPSPNNPLLSAPNCLITPHLGWSSFESRQRCLNVSVENVKAFLNGTPQNVVN